MNYHLFGVLILAIWGWILGGTWTPVLAQGIPRIDLNEALHQGRLHWILLRSDSLRWQARSLELKGGPLPDPALLQTEWGQFNSALRDQSIELSQTMRLPVYHRRSRDLAKTRLEGARLEQARTLAELEAGIIRLYYRYLVQEARCQLFEYRDSLLKVTLGAMRQQQQQGQVSAADLNALLLTDAESKLQCASLRREQDQIIRDFQFWTGKKALPDSHKIDLRWVPAAPALVDTLTHPEVLRLHNQWQEAKAMSRLTQAQRLPGLSLGLRNMSIQGMGPDGQFYPLSRRFNTLQAGISLPLRGRPWRLQVEADRRIAESAALQYQHGLAYAANERTRDQEQMRNLLEQYNFSKLNLLPLADTLQSQAKTQHNLGELSFLQWTQHMERILLTRAQHLDLIEQLNDATIQWHYPNRTNQPR
ncbi:MAG: TolC family protein [Bacteroidia bacterium]